LATEKIENVFWLFSALPENPPFEFARHDLAAFNSGRPLIESIARAHLRNAALPAVGESGPTNAPLVQLEALIALVVRKSIEEKWNPKFVQHLGSWHVDSPSQSAIQIERNEI